MTTQPSSPVPADPRRWLVLTLVALAQFIVALDATIVNVALPSIERDLQMSASSLQWVVNAYALIFGGFLLLGGRLADILGRKRVFLAGVVVFTVASAISGLADNAWTLTIGRGLQGLGGALISPAALSILNTTFRDPGERTKALGVWGAIVAGGSAFGLLVGGVLTDTLSWSWIFFINLPLGAGVVLLGLRLIAESREDETSRSLDLAGAITGTAGLVLMVYALVNFNFPLAGAGLVLLAAFVFIESRAKNPLLRLGILRIRTLAVADTALIFLTSGIFTMFFFSALYLQNALGYTALQGGLAFLPAAIGVMVGATLAEPIVRRLGHVIVTAIGLGLAAAGMVWLARLPIDGSYVTDLLPGLLPLAIGLGIAYVPITFLATSGVADSDAGLASGIYQTVQQIGGAIGLAILSVFAYVRTQSALDDGATKVAADVAGYRMAFAAGAVLLVCGAVFTLALLRRRHVEPLLAAEAQTVAVTEKSEEPVAVTAP